jgi:uncharacterized protein YigE (DUF2233 family)
MNRKIRLVLILFVCVLFAGCRYANRNGSARTINFEGHRYDVFPASYPRDKIRMFWKDDNGDKIKSLGNLKTEVSKKGQQLVFATNGGMYMEDNSPLGLYIENGVEKSHINLSLNGKSNFYLQPNGIFFVSDSFARIVPTEKYIPFKDKALYATQSGPMLVIDGNINKAFSKGSSNTYIRNGVGIDNKGTVIFAISNEAVNFYDFASFFKDALKCKNALFLDGSISRMYLPGLDRNDLGGDFGVIIGVVR